MKSRHGGPLVPRAGLSAILLPRLRTCHHTVYRGAGCRGFYPDAYRESLAEVVHPELSRILSEGEGLWINKSWNFLATVA
ncbi:MAG: hypothetical protein L0Y35_06930 [Flammeovirgaceae bacterium]|nr:hypothetical protein [Flammeovirgaceae bacterium]